MKSAKALIVAGIALIALSLGALGYWQYADAKSEATAKEILQQLDAALPPLHPGTRDTYRVMEMPVLEIDGHDIIAIVEIPAFSLRLPVQSSWEQGSALPRRFSGSVYDDSLIIGGTSAQFACFAQIPNDTVVTVTDMTGAVFTYTVTRIGRSAAADPAALTGSRLTLFTRQQTNLEYILLRCN